MVKSLRIDTRIISVFVSRLFTQPWSNNSWNIESPWRRHASSSGRNIHQKCSRILRSQNGTNRSDRWHARHDAFVKIGFITSSSSIRIPTEKWLLKGIIGDNSRRRPKKWPACHLAGHSLPRSMIGWMARYQTFSPIYHVTQPDSLTQSSDRHKCRNNTKISESKQCHFA